MSIDVLMPALSPTMEEGTLAKWNVKVGDAVSSGDVIAEIETDKATMEVEAVDEGVVEALLVAAGTEGVKVNTPIATLREEAASGAAATPALDGEAMKGRSAADKTRPAIQRRNRRKRLRRGATPARARGPLLSFQRLPPTRSCPRTPGW